jgi:hypothetical protein
LRNNIPRDTFELPIVRSGTLFAEEGRAKAVPTLPSPGYPGREYRFDARTSSNPDNATDIRRTIKPQALAQEGKHYEARNIVLFDRAAVHGPIHGVPGESGKG